MRGNMRSERERRGLTTEEVAKEVGVHKNALQRWERGESEPLASGIVRLAKFYEVSVEYLLEQTDDPHAAVIPKI